MVSYAPLFSQIVDSSIWREPYYVRILWMTMLAKKDADHVVRGNAYHLSMWANISEQEAIDGLKVLSSPDTRRIEPQPYEGRRIQKVEEGWLILNGAKYLQMARKLAERARKAKWAREHRLRNGTPLPGETTYVRTLEEHGQEVADRSILQ